MILDGGGPATSRELLPPSFDAGLYQTLYPDAAMVWNGPIGAGAGAAFALEIGASNKPPLNGLNAMYFDVLAQAITGGRRACYRQATLHEMIVL